MANFNMFIFKGEYNNSDVFIRTLKYIFGLENPYKYYFGVYPMTPDGAIDSFTQTHNINTLAHSNHRVLHCFLSIECSNCHHGCKTCHKKAVLFHTSDYIADLLSPNYQICYALHDDTEYLHMHFLISTTSYVPSGVPLSFQIFKSVYIPQIRHFIKQHGYSFYFGGIKKEAPYVR